MKSCVLNYINHAKMLGEEICVPDLVASFQNSVVDSLVSRAVSAAKEFGYLKLAIAGGGCVQYGLKGRDGSRLPERGAFLLLSVAGFLHG